MEKTDKYGAIVFARNCEDGRSFSLSTALVRNHSPPPIFEFQIYKFKGKTGGNKNVLRSERMWKKNQGIKKFTSINAESAIRTLEY